MSAPDVPLGALTMRREPAQQVEIQLGHLCNNRCVFCVSGQRTARGQAGVSELAPILDEITRAHARGHRKITLLGGEPTLQPAFLPILRACAELGFDEVVVFTNGAKTASGQLIDQALATGAKLSFRISIQGATEQSHERTTQKDGSFGRIVRTLEHLRARGLRTTVNMCLVSSNYQDVHRFAALLVPYGVQQLHVDLMRPLDAGDRTEDEIARTLAPLGLIGPELERMVQAFDPTFDVNLGNLPFCLAPAVAHRIHHDGSTTETIATDGASLSAPWDKYAVKKRDKVKPERCGRCAFDAHCSGIYAEYLRHQGEGALVPIEGTALAALDPEWIAVHLRALVRSLEQDRDGRAIEVGHEDLSALVLTSGSDRVRLVRRSARPIGRYARFDVEGAPGTELTSGLARALERVHEPAIVPLTDGPVSGAISGALARLMGSAPFEPLSWHRTRVRGPGVELDLRAPGGGEAKVALGLDAHGRVSLRYEIADGTGPDDRDAFRRGLTQLVGSLRSSERKSASL